MNDPIKTITTEEAQISNKTISAYMGADSVGAESGRQNFLNAKAIEEAIKEDKILGNIPSGSIPSGSISSKFSVEGKKDKNFNLDNFVGVDILLQLALFIVSIALISLKIKDFGQVISDVLMVVTIFVSIFILWLKPEWQKYMPFYYIILGVIIVLINQSETNKEEKNKNKKDILGVKNGNGFLIIIISMNIFYFTLRYLILRYVLNKYYNQDY